MILDTLCYAPSNRAKLLYSRGNCSQGRITAKGAFHFLCAVPHKKWNVIEHRLFSAISINWAGRPLDSFETILNYIRTTTTKTGLRVRAERVTAEYRKGIKISDDQMARLDLHPAKTLPRWNYKIRCQPHVAPAPNPIPPNDTGSSDPQLPS